MKNGNGKRERSKQEEDSEFMPLSKRINNIHLTQGQNGIQYLNGHDGATTSQIQNSAPHNGHNAPENHVNPNDQMNGLYNGHLLHSSGISMYSSNMSSANATNNTAAVNNHHSSTNGSSHGPTHCQPSMSNDVQGHSYENQSLPSSNNIPDANFSCDFRYDPALNHIANPHYYEQNRQLFELYVERISRHNLPPHPNFYNGNDSAHSNHHHSQP